MQSHLGFASKRSKCPECGVSTLFGLSSSSLWLSEFRQARRVNSFSRKHRDGFIGKKFALLHSTYPTAQHLTARAPTPPVSFIVYFLAWGGFSGVRRDEPSTGIGPVEALSLCRRANVQARRWTFYRDRACRATLAGRRAFAVASCAYITAPAPSPQHVQYGQIPVPCNCRTHIAFGMIRMIRVHFGWCALPNTFYRAAAATSWYYDDDYYDHRRHHHHHHYY